LTIFNDEAPRLLERGTGVSAAVLAEEPIINAWDTGVFNSCYFGLIILNKEAPRFVFCFSSITGTTFVGGEFAAGTVNSGSGLISLNKDAPRFAFGFSLIIGTTFYGNEFSTGLVNSGSGLISLNKDSPRFGFTFVTDVTALVSGTLITYTI